MKDGIFSTKKEIGLRKESVLIAKAQMIKLFVGGFLVLAALILGLYFK